MLRSRALAPVAVLLTPVELLPNGPLAKGAVPVSRVSPPAEGTRQRWGSGLELAGQDGFCGRAARGIDPVTLALERIVGKLHQVAAQRK